MGLHLWAAGAAAHPAGISDLLAEASAEGDGPVPGYLSAPESMTDTCLYIFTSGTTDEGGRGANLPKTQAEGGRTSSGPRPSVQDPQRGSASHMRPRRPSQASCVSSCLDFPRLRASLAAAAASRGTPSRGTEGSGLALSPFPGLARPQASPRRPASVT